MVLDNEQKNRIQENMIKKLTNENNELIKKINYLESKIEILVEKLDKMQESKIKFDKLVEDMENTKIEYRITYDMYKRLTNIE